MYEDKMKKQPFCLLRFVLCVEIFSESRAKLSYTLLDAIKNWAFFAQKMTLRKKTSFKNFENYIN